jgi:hypothetical protein
MGNMKRMLGAAGAGALLVGLMFASTGAVLAADNTQYWQGNGVVDGQATVDCTNADPGTMLWIWTGTGSNVNISVDGEVVAGVQKGQGTFQFTTGWHDIGDLTPGDGGNVFVTYDGAADGNAVLTLSHVCPGESSSTTTFSSSVESTTVSSSSTTTFNSSVESTTTQPPTDTIDNTSSSQRSSILWLLVAGLGAVLGSVVVLAPSRAKRQ